MANIVYLFKDLVELICNVQEMEEAIMEMKYDTKKAPLGKNGIV